MGRAGRADLPSAPLAVCHPCRPAPAPLPTKIIASDPTSRGTACLRNARTIVGGASLPVIHPVGLRSIRTRSLFCDTGLPLGRLSNPVLVNPAGSRGKRAFWAFGRPLHLGLQSSKSHLQTVHASSLGLRCFGMVTKIGTANLHCRIALPVLARGVRQYKGSDKCPGERYSHSAHAYGSKQATCHRRSFRIIR